MDRKLKKKPDRKFLKNIHKLDKAMRRFVKSLARWVRIDNGKRKWRKK